MRDLDLRHFPSPPFGESRSTSNIIHGPRGDNDLRKSPLSIEFYGFAARGWNTVG
jgi:hypothetical protein